ncbi:MAG: thioredoxin domain-containing protein, partial [Flavobacteriales bacterium]|nr:thioredoxin domain-containing protein [Flavobacteriales bacterium]
MKSYLVLLLTTCCLLSCEEAKNQSEEMSEKANRLIEASSPYLLQHAYNPVDWRAWNEESLQAAKDQDKPILISIGYSACHWCHVMEKESFEDDSVAKIMNEHFICIKVDREERPDIDHLYMDATQLMTGKGGWPLNCFALPNGKPFYGGTYFPKDQWINVLNQLADVYKNEREKVEEYAEKLSQGLQEQSVIEIEDIPEEFNSEILMSSVRNWKQNFDTVDGGSNYAPKFPMPNNYQFLLQYLQFYPDREVETQLKLSLEKMAMGGIYDQIGGGFARYSTDMEWKVPHFEKMLYDNAQLIALYSQAYKKYKDPLYEKVVRQTIAFMKRELMDESAAFYSALDADSEGEEGKFYVWEIEELKKAFNEDDLKLLSEYYNINEKGEWEGKYILLKTERDEAIAQRLGIEISELKSRMEKLEEQLMKIRSERVRPGLDDKSLTSWNALNINGLLEAYEAFGDKEYLKMATACGNFIAKSQMKSDGSLYHSYKDG